MKLKSFFTKWVYRAVILILIGLIFAEMQQSHPSHAYLLGLISKLFESVGIAMLVASVFSFTLGTEEFLNYIRDRLMSIVISKDFVTKLSSTEQKSLLQMVLKPSRQLSEIYSGITEYFDQYVEDSMRLADTCYRGHMNLHAVASINKEKGSTQILMDADYIIYRVADKFDPLILYLDDECFEHIQTKVIGANGEEEILSGDSIEPIPCNEIDDPDMKKGYLMHVPEKFNNLHNITVSRRIVEYGNDHWQLFSYKMVKPCHKLSITLRCEDGLVIKDCHTYGAQEKFTIERDERSVRVKFHDWLSPGFGVCIVIAKEDFHK